MYPKNILRCYDKAIDKKTCNKIIKVGKSKKLQDAKIEAHGKPAVDEKIRRTNLSWTNESWIYDLVTPYIENANIANKWNKTPEKFKGKQDILRVKEMANQGSIIVFNSVTFHRVLPVTEGTRYSLVVWALGNDWK